MRQRLADRVSVGEQRAQRVAGERGVAERGAAVPGHVAEQHADAPVLEREHVVEVAARCRPVGRPVRGAHREAAEVVRYGREQRAGEQADVVDQRRPLRLERRALCATASTRCRPATARAGQGCRAPRGSPAGAPRPARPARRRCVRRGPAGSGVATAAVPGSAARRAASRAAACVRGARGVSAARRVGAAAGRGARDRAPARGVAAVGRAAAPACGGRGRGRRRGRGRSGRRRARGRLWHRHRRRDGYVGRFERELRVRSQAAPAAPAGQAPRYRGQLRDLDGRVDRERRELGGRRRRGGDQSRPEHCGDHRPAHPVRASRPASAVPEERLTRSSAFGRADYGVTALLSACSASVSSGGGSNGARSGWHTVPRRGSSSPIT